MRDARWLHARHRAAEDVTRAIEELVDQLEYPSISIFASAHAPRYSLWRKALAGVFSYQDHFNQRAEERAKEILREERARREFLKKNAPLTTEFDLDVAVTLLCMAEDSMFRPFPPPAAKEQVEGSDMLQVRLEDIEVLARNVERKAIRSIFHEAGQHQVWKDWWRDVLSRMIAAAEESPSSGEERISREFSEVEVCLHLLEEGVVHEDLDRSSSDVPAEVHEKLEALADEASINVVLSFLKSYAKAMRERISACDVSVVKHLVDYDRHTGGFRRLSSSVRPTGPTAASRRKAGARTDVQGSSKADSETFVAVVLKSFRDKSLFVQVKSIEFDMLSSRVEPWFDSILETFVDVNWRTRRKISPDSLAVHPSVVSFLVHRLSSPTREGQDLQASDADDQERRHQLAALGALAIFAQNEENVSKSGALDSLVQLLTGFMQGDAQQDVFTARLFALANSLCKFDAVLAPLLACGYSEKAVRSLDRARESELVNESMLFLAVNATVNHGEVVGAEANLTEEAVTRASQVVDQLDPTRGRDAMATGLVDKYLKLLRAIAVQHPEMIPVNVIGQIKTALTYMWDLKSVLENACLVLQAACWGHEERKQACHDSGLSSFLLKLLDRCKVDKDSSQHLFTSIRILSSPASRLHKAIAQHVEVFFRVLDLHRGVGSLVESVCLIFCNISKHDSSSLLHHSEKLIDYVAQHEQEPKIARNGIWLLANICEDLEFWDLYDDEYVYEIVLHLMILHEDDQELQYASLHLALLLLKQRGELQNEEMLLHLRKQVQTSMLKHSEHAGICRFGDMYLRYSSSL